MKTELLRVTQKLDIIEENPETLEQELYFSRIEDVGERVLRIAPPFRRGFYLPPRPGRKIVARVVSDKIPYMFETTLARYIPDQIPLWEINRPEKFRKIQMRENVRLDIALKVTMAPLEDDDETKILRALTKDVSVGGALFAVQHAIEIGERYMIKIVFSPQLILEAECEVVRLIPPTPPQDRYFAGVRFKEKDIDESLKKKIIQFIFLKQAELRQKEKTWFG